MTSSKTWLLWVLSTVSFILPAAVEQRPGFEWEEVGKWAIQDRGRLKPIDTFASDTVLFITGKRSYQTKEGVTLGPVEVLFGWLFHFDVEWENEEFIRIDYKPLKTLLKIDDTVAYLSPKALRENDELPKFLREVMKKEQRREKLNELEKKAVQLSSQRNVLDAIVAGEVMTFLPNPSGLNETWYSIAALTQPGSTPYTKEKLEAIGSSIKLMMESYLAKEAGPFNQAVRQVGPNLKNLGAYPSESSLEREIHYNHLHPFRWAWVLYTIAFVALLIHLVSGNSAARVAGGSLVLAGFALHAYGFIIRCLISGRPPVTNMYESVIWVTWGCVLFSLLIWLAYKKPAIPAAALVFAVVGLVLADNLPSVLDPGIHPLEPVLRSNYWLTIHVLTITLSYAAFALSLCLGNVVLGNYLLRPQATTIIQQYSLYMYRAMQIGVVLLAAGTILGGVWADYSWGRFWGWDPKEVWALIALLLYLAVLHGRFTGWLRGFGFAATTVVAFLGVLMAWYGVNFVLGVGLHSYGFGTGGLGYVSSYVGAQVLFILAAYFRYLKEGKTNSPIFPAGR